MIYKSKFMYQNKHISFFKKEFLLQRIIFLLLFFVLSPFPTENDDIMNTFSIARLQNLCKKKVNKQN